MKVWDYIGVVVTAALMGIELLLFLQTKQGKYLFLTAFILAYLVVAYQGARKRW